MNLNSHVENITEGEQSVGNTKLKTYGKDRIGHANGTMC